MANFLLVRNSKRLDSHVNSARRQRLTQQIRRFHHKSRCDKNHSCHQLPHRSLDYFSVLNFGYGPAYPRSWPRACIEGKHQSPIDLQNAEKAGKDSMVYGRYYDVSGPIWIENNGHTSKV